MDRAKCFFDTTDRLLALAHYLLLLTGFLTGAAAAQARTSGEIYGPLCDKIGLTEKLGDAYIVHHSQGISFH